MRKNLLKLSVSLFVAMCGVLVADQTWAQDGKTVSGQVTSSDDQSPLPGVNVLLKGTSNGTTTDAEGKFSLNVPDDEAVLIFTFIGFLPKEITVGNQTTFNLSLDSDIAQLSEVVVVGYGTQKRSDITGSVTSVPKDRLTNLPVTNVTQALQGSTAGLQITQASSVPGSAGSIQIRGINSINANTSPFIALDGMPFFGTLNDINPNDISSIEILKDASAVAIYGTRGSNGVILITTKRGANKDGKPNINFNAYAGVEDISNPLNPMGAEQYVQKYKDFLIANGITQTAVLPNLAERQNYDSGTTTDWMKQATQTGKIQEYNLSVSGGTQKVQYYFSATRLIQDGVIKGFQYNRTTVRSNLDAQVTDGLKVGMSSFFTDNNFDGGRAHLLQATAMSPYSVPKDANGKYIIYPMAPEQLFVNPLLGLTTDRDDGNKNLTGSGYVEVTPKFAKGLKYQLKGSYVYTFGKVSTYAGRAANDNSGTATVRDSTTNNWVVENVVSYNKDINKHHFDITGVYSAQKVSTLETEASASGFINDGLSYYDLLAGNSKSANSEANTYTLLSQLGRINYTYDNRYMLTLTARRDGYSAFGANKSKFGLFPSMAVGWNLHNEAFMSDFSDVVSQIKLRLSYGKTGNQAIAPNQTFTTATTVQQPFGGSIQTGVLYNTLGNGNLSWESTTTLNGAIDFGLFDDRITGSFEVFKSKTEDILLRRALPGVNGYTDMWTNLGKMQNVGIELTVSSVNVDKGDFKWETSVNFSTYKNKILELYGDGKDDIGNSWFIGEPLRVIYGYEKIGVWQTDDIGDYDPVAKPGDIKFKDQPTVDTNGDGRPDAGDGIIDAKDRVIIGQRNPKWYGGITNTFHYKNFHLSIFIQTSQGGIKRNADLTYADEAGRRNLPEGFQYWTPENPGNYWPSLSAYKNYRGYHFAEDWSYVRLKDVRLSYNVPSSFLSRYGVNALTVYAAGRNLHTWTNWFGWDPEMNYASRGSTGDQLNYPVVRSLSLGINLSL
ncbi:SusC/RagA family TonB-linked outer membrane protein [Pseudochryseolinea flava]|uniref:SusC/RagA family TonB-linked outer membrane protein n=1 Tax=Pseudochryseolinea flava TaxID=2059302 RepID=A0A364XXH6_9BACT|nr:TonB-dependent receptor [Pseudochryseolinea flava]RAV98248.1 SusC/RagA family TonB-linked outer membrane protein [Pseudochryseolinea flava]